MCQLFSRFAVDSACLTCRCACCAGLVSCITDFKDVFTPEAANATAYSNSVVGTNTWQWWNKERGEWAVYAITVAAKQPSEELPPVASITSPAPPVKPAPQPEQTDGTDVTTTVSQLTPAAAMQEPRMETQPQSQPQIQPLQSQPTQPQPQPQPQTDATSTPPATDTAGHDQHIPPKAMLAAEQAPVAVSPEEPAAAVPPKPVMAG
jgi:hypothetical protein